MREGQWDSVGVESRSMSPVGDGRRVGATAPGRPDAHQHSGGIAVISRRLRRMYLPPLVGVLSGLTVFAVTRSAQADVGAALGIITAIAAFSAAQGYLLFRWWPAHREGTEAAARHAATAAAAPWFDRVLEPTLPLPSLSGWALEPDTAGFLVRWILQEKPEMIVELGSGVSTLLFAYALEANGRGSLLSVDAEETYAARTRDLLRTHGLEHRARVHHAPFEPLDLDTWKGRWFQLDVLLPIEDGTVDLLVVDGPPKSTGRLARYPALPILIRKLRSSATVAVDDADRTAERTMVDAWIREGHLQPGSRVAPLRSGARSRTAQWTRHEYQRGTGWLRGGGDPAHGHDTTLGSSFRKARTSSIQGSNAGSCSRMRWFALSSSTKRAPGIPAASSRPRSGWMR
jgi:predicted O-methyltransferase YrrM